MSADDLKTLVTVCAVVLLFVGFYLAGAPINECGRCDHCRQQRLDAARNRVYATCPMCFRKHPPSERCQ